MRWLLALAALLLAQPAAAHLSPNSAINLDFGERRVAAEIVVPLSELDYARGRKLASLAAERPAVEAYLRERIAVSTPEGRPWRLAFESIDIVRDEGPPDLVARLSLVPPEGESARRFLLRYSAVIDSAPNHFALVFARSDYGGGRLHGEPALIGGLQKSVTTLAVDRGEASAWAGFAASIGLGMEHIVAGHDHLLFLVALILPAPLLVSGGRWGGYAGGRTMARRLVAVVTAFTIGHSLTLIGGAFFGWRLPAQPVEVLIALSVLVSAMHALRPLFPEREGVAAGLFGLVHGLAFATLVGDYGLEPMQKAQSILGFNLGIELIQLAVVAAVAPSLAIFARTPAYRPIRIAGACFAAVAAAAWMAERLLGAENAVAGAIGALLGHGGWLIAALAVGALMMLGRAKTRTA